MSGWFWRQKPESLRKWRSEISTEIRSIKLKIPPHRLGSRLSAVRAPSRETASSDLSSVASLGGKTITGAVCRYSGWCWSVTCDQGFCCLAPPLFISWCLIITFICLSINTPQSRAGGHNHGESSGRQEALLATGCQFTQTQDRPQHGMSKSVFEV